MSQHFNPLRARSAAAALEAFRKYDGHDDDRSSILDLITDLGHLACQCDLDFVQLVAQAVSVWAYERRHPDGAGASPQVTVTIAGRRPRCAWTRKDGAA
jgi:hypothetical protein